MFKKNILILILVSAFCVLSAQNKKPYTAYFGLNLMQNVSGGTEHFAIVRVYDNGEIEHKIISRKNWMLQFSGHQESDANPDSKNFFLKYEIDVRTLQNLWKLRYSDYPYKSKIHTYGWSNNSYSPSDAQMRYLKKYGFETVSTFIYGSNLIKLLQDMMSHEWVDNYKNLE